jgi:hypothetical protein
MDDVEPGPLTRTERWFLKAASTSHLVASLILWFGIIFMFAGIVSVLVALLGYHGTSHAGFALVAGLFMVTHALTLMGARKYLARSAVRPA